MATYLDKACRFLIKQDAAGFCHWLFGGDLPPHFQLWLDARRAALPEQNDLTNDLVARCSRHENVSEPFDVAIEIMSEARSEILSRMLATSPGSRRSNRSQRTSGAL